MKFLKRIIMQPENGEDIECEIEDDLLKETNDRVKKLEKHIVGTTLEEDIGKMKGKKKRELQHALSVVEGL